MERLKLCISSDVNAGISFEVISLKYPDIEISKLESLYDECIQERRGLHRNVIKHHEECVDSYSDRQSRMTRLGAAESMISDTSSNTTNYENGL